MAVNKSVIENVELENGGEVSVYVVRDRASLGVQIKDIDFSVWLSAEELKQVAEMINKALEQ